MSFFNIITNEKTLRQKCDLVDKTEIETNAMQSFLQDMFKTLESANGIGLAAPQVGVSSQICIINLWNQRLVLINPQIIRYSRKKEISEEGCLSFPRKFIPVQRAKKIKIKYLDEKGKKRKVKVRDLLARVIQHEVDHLNGILFIDRQIK